MDPNGEQSLSYQDMQDVAPDVMNGPGQKQVAQTVLDATKMKPKLDNALKMVAAQNGLDMSDFESRIKNHDTIVRKIALHRKNGKDGYNERDVNDIYGARFIADTPQQKRHLIEDIRDLAKNNFFKKEKEEQVDDGTYHAYHFDFKVGNVKGEIQIHDPHSMLESVVNHEIRAQYGDNPPPEVNKLKQTAAASSYKLPADQAQMMGQIIQRAKQQLVKPF